MLCNLKPDINTGNQKCRESPWLFSHGAAFSLVAPGELGAPLSPAPGTGFSHIHLLQPRFCGRFLTYSCQHTGCQHPLLPVEKHRNLLGPLGLGRAHLEAILSQEQPAFPNPQEFAQDLHGFSCSHVSLRLVATFCPEKLQNCSPFSAILALDVTLISSTP